MLLLALALSCNKSAPAGVPVDRKADEAIRAEARAFYRDLAAQDTPALLNHFWPAKIAARWEPPFEPSAPATVALVSPAIIGSARGARACTPGDSAVASAKLTIEGTWARAAVPRCTEGEDELWLLQFEGRWKIVRLTLAK
jgi:hypothetical protein